MHSQTDEHPVQRLFGLLGLLNDDDYPVELVAVRRPITGTAFFPGGYGLWRKTPSGPLPPMPCGKVMVLGNNFDSECGYRKSLRAGDELHAPTWKALVPFLLGVDIQPEDCFFTNAYMGLLRGCPTNEGESPGARDPKFRRFCERLLDRQIAEQKPGLILTLGQYAPKFLASLTPDLDEWRKWPGFRALDASASGPVRHVHFGETRKQTTVVALLHPSGRDRNLHLRHYGGRTGNEAELAMLKEALAAAQLT